jgi:hypothetical protein
MTLSAFRRLASIDFLVASDLAMISVRVQTSRDLAPIAKAFVPKVIRPNRANPSRQTGPMMRDLSQAKTRNKLRITNPISNRQSLSTIELPRRTTNQATGLAKAKRANAIGGNRVVRGLDFSRPMASVRLTAAPNSMARVRQKHSVRWMANVRRMVIVRDQWMVTLTLAASRGSKGDRPDLIPCDAWIATLVYLQRDASIRMMKSHIL